MDQYGFEPDHSDPAWLEEEPLMTTSRHEIMSYLVPLTAPGRDDPAV